MTVLSFEAAPRRVIAATSPPAMTIGGAPRVPSTFRPNWVNAAITITCTDAQNRTVNLEVETAPGSGVYAAEAICRSNPDVGGAVGVTITDIRTYTLSVVVPPGHGYRFTQAGTGTAVITQIRENLI